MLDILIQSRRNTAAAHKFFRKLLKPQRFVPRVIITDKLALITMQNINNVDNKATAWNKFYTGSLILTLEEIEEYINVLSILHTTSPKLRPYIKNEKCPSPAMIIHSATQTKKHFETDLSNLINGVHVYDCATYIETRSVFLANPGDLVVGRTKPWHLAADSSSIDKVDVGGLEYYYLSHALLDGAKNKSPAIDQLIEYLRLNPETLVRLYALDKEMQIFLSWLATKAELKYLNVDVNSQIVDSIWNKKAPLHPAVKKVEFLDKKNSRQRPAEILDSEQKYSKLYTELGIFVPTIPGYTIERANADEKDFTIQLLTAAKLLQSRYGLSFGCLKASKGADGAYITPNIDLNDVDRLQQVAINTYRNNDDYVLEANVQYETYHLGSRQLICVPSAHIRYGQVVTTLTMQLMDALTWVGNVSFDESTLSEFNMNINQYQVILRTMNHFLAGFKGSFCGSVSEDLALATAGVDFAIGRIGGYFGDQVFVAMQDLNLSSHGAEYLRTLLERLPQKDSYSQNRYIATRVIRPSFDATLERLTKTLNEIVKSNICYSIIASVPGCWAMFASMGHSSLEVADSLVELEIELDNRGLLASSAD